MINPHDPKGPDRDPLNQVVIDGPSSDSGPHIQQGCLGVAGDRWSETLLLS
jgi:hypothetical protein